MANTFTANLNLAIPDPGDLSWENEVVLTDGSPFEKTFLGTTIMFSNSD